MKIPLEELDKVIRQLSLAPDPDKEYKVPISMVLNLCIELREARGKCEALDAPVSKPIE